MQRGPQERPRKKATKVFHFYKFISGFLRDAPTIQSQQNGSTGDLFS